MFRTIRLVIVLFAGLGLVGLFILALPTSAAQQASPRTTIVVNTLNDELNNDGFCSLREAITAANDNTATGACPAGDGVLIDTVTFDVNGTIYLTDQLSVTAGGPLVINGGETITVSGNDSVRLFYVESGADLILENTTVTEGFNVNNSGGGGISNSGILRIYNSTISNNRNFDDINYSGGGGIYNDGTLHIHHSTIKDCGSYKAGGINNIGATIISDSILSNNDAAWGGGGIGNAGTLTITNSTIIGNINELSHGGGIFNSGTVHITNSTITGNYTADYELSYGGGIFNNLGTLYITNSTITGNNADEGGGIYSSDSHEAVSMIYNTIISENEPGGNCYGEIIDGGHNIEDANSCGWSSANDSMSNTDPLLGPLQDNGGPTLTRALLLGSPAIDAAEPANCPPTDQRGVERPFDGNGDGLEICDIGSYEFAYVIAMDPPFQTSSAAPGEMVNYSIDLYNFTGMTDIYTLTMGSHTWGTVLSTRLIGPIPNGGSQHFWITVTIPLTPTWYMTDTVTVSATSLTSPTVYSATARITTQTQISISPTALTSTQYAEQIVTLPLTISNGFEVPLTFTIIPLGGASWLSLEPHSGSVNANSSTQVLVTLDAAGLFPGEYTETLILEINNPDKRSVSIPVSLTVEAQPKIFIPLISRHFCPDFFDDFSNPASGWDILDDEYEHTEYLSGKYRVAPKQIDYFYYYTAPTCSRQNYVVEVDAYWASTPGGSYGILFGTPPDFSRLYFYYIDPYWQEFIVIRGDSSGWTIIVPWTYSSAIHFGTASNHLKLTLEGIYFTLEVNGVFLGQWSDGSFTNDRTYAGVMVFPYYEQPAYDVRFDNFSVKALPSSGSTYKAEHGFIIPTCRSRALTDSCILIPAIGELWKSNGDVDH